MSYNLSDADRGVIVHAISEAELSCQYALAKDLRAILTRASAATVAEPPTFTRYAAHEQACKEAAQRTVDLHTYLASSDPEGHRQAIADHEAEQQAKHQAEPALVQMRMRDRKYVDSTPHLHVGNSAFEDWYQQHPKACVGYKQLARDAYAAGMGDPLVMARDAAQQQAQPECPRCGLTVSPESCDCAEARAVRTKQQAEPVADELTDALITAAGRRAALYDGDPRDCIKTDVMNAFYAGAQFAAQSGQRAGAADGWMLVPIEPTPEMLEQIKFFDDITDRAMTARYKAMLAAAPTTQQRAEPGADERAAFEDWMRANRYDVGTFASGEYHNMFARNAWMGWQARAAQSGQLAGAGNTRAAAILRWVTHVLDDIIRTDSDYREGSRLNLGSERDRFKRALQKLHEAQALLAAAPTPAAQEGEQP